MSTATNLKETFMKGDGGKSQLFELASTFARNLSSNDVKHHQLRNLLDFVIWSKQSHTQGPEAELSPETRGRVATLRPRLAYMAARMPRLFELQKAMDDLLKESRAIKTGRDLGRLYDFAAALVAYHKYFGEEQKQSQAAARGGNRR